MNKITVGIISDNKKLRFVYNMLLTQDTADQVEVMFAVRSIDELGSVLGRVVQPDVLLLDYRQVYTDRTLYFSYLWNFFSMSNILLIVEESEIDSQKASFNGFVQGFVGLYSTSQALAAAIFKAAPKCLPTF